MPLTPDIKPCVVRLLGLRVAEGNICLKSRIEQLAFDPKQDLLILENLLVVDPTPNNSRATPSATVAGLLTRTSF